MKETMLEYVLRNLERTKGSWTQVAENSGVSKRTLEKIARGETQDPGVNNVQALHDYFRTEQEAA